MAETKYDHGTFTSADDTDIYYQSWTPESARGLLVVAHGLGEHGGRYGHVVDAVAPLGLAVWAIDHRGHGRSGGRRGHAMAFSEFVGDLRAFVDLAKTREPGKKVFLLGHSLGGLIALTYALDHADTIAGVVASGPALRLGVEVPKLKAAIGRRLADLWPTLAMGNGLNPADLSHDSREVQKYKDDPLVHDRVTARFFIEFTGQMRATAARGGDLALPCLIQQGGADPIIHPDGARSFFADLAATDRALHVYDGFYHEIYNEIQRARPLADLAAWLQARL
jgi:alpha-beta hydrolase superfamily lysophospholipase